MGNTTLTAGDVAISGMAPVQAPPQGDPVPTTEASPMVAPPMKLILKLGETMAALHRIPKNGWNDFHKYQYAMEADVVEAVREELAKRHIMLIPQIDSWETEKVGEKGERFTTVKMTFTFLDGESGETMSKPWLGQAADKGDKGLWKAITGATKYFIMKSFLLPTGDDPENDSAAPSSSAPSAVAAAPVGKPSLRMAKSETPQPEPVSTIASQLRASLEAAGLPVSKVSVESAGPDGFAIITQLRSDEWGWCHVTLANGQSAKTKVKRNIDKLRTAESTRLPVRLGLTTGGLIDTVELPEQPF